jgi:hypothetical protein
MNFGLQMSDAAVSKIYEVWRVVLEGEGPDFNFLTLCNM